MRCLLLALGVTLVAAVPVAALAQDASSPAGNLQVGLILSGLFYDDTADGAGAGELVEGFNLGESELGLTATVDHWLDAGITLAFDAEAAGVEEAALVTRALPAGWQLRAGKFLSGFGYENGRHAHSRDFVDQNLAYETLLGGEGINDSGVQVTWLPPLDTYVQVGAEALQGEQEVFGAAIDLGEAADALAVPADTLKPLDRHGPQLFTAFVRVAPDLGTLDALQLGASVALHRDQQEMQIQGTDLLYARGSAQALGLEAVWKRNATGNYGVGSARVQAEYLRRQDRLDIVHDTVASDIGKGVQVTRDGFYLQGVVGFAPRWEAGLRYDAVDWTHRASTAGVDSTIDASERIAAELTLRPSEYSHLRLQLAHARMADAGEGSPNFSQVMLQYNLSMGAHRAHAF